jgi:hypothetical protein
VIVPTRNMKKVNLKIPGVKIKEFLQDNVYSK